MATPSVAVVILSWNGWSFLEKFLPSVLQTTYPNARIIVADNASTDESVANLQSHFPQVEVIALTENHGFANGYNEALKQVESRLLRPPQPGCRSRTRLDRTRH